MRDPVSTAGMTAHLLAYQAFAVNMHKALLCVADCWGRQAFKLKLMSSPHVRLGRLA